MTANQIWGNGGSSDTTGAEMKKKKVNKSEFNIGANDQSQKEEW